MPHDARGADATPFEIDAILSMNGPLTFLGKAEADTLSILETSTNKQGGIRGRPVHFVLHDDRSDPQVALQLLSTIEQKRPAIVLGSSSAASCTAMAASTATNGPVEYCLSPAIYPNRGSYVFSASVSSRDCLIALVRNFRERGWKRLGILFSTDIGGRDAETNLATVMSLPENKDVTIVDREYFNPSAVSVTAQLTHIKAANPQAVILWSAGTPFGTALRGAAEVALNVPIGTANANLTYAQMKQYASFMPKELYVPGLAFLAHQAPTRAALDVQDRFYAECAAASIRPDFLQNSAWDPALIAISAFRTLGTTASAEQVRNYILNLHGFTGLSGDYDFRDGSQRGLSERNLMIVRWNGDKETWDSESRPGGALKR
jgi:branched-chain amino acid transport system substrate-binding protein